VLNRKKCSEGPYKFCTFRVTLKIRLFFLKKIDFPDALTQGVKKIDVKTVFINEPGLYLLIMKSKLPQAIEFQKWVYAGFKNGGVFTIFFAFLFTLENQSVLP
jgi:hypothetical protein